MSQFMPENGAIITVNQPAPEPVGDAPALAQATLAIIEKKKKKRTPVGFFRAALWMLRKRRGKKPVSVERKAIADKPSEDVRDSNGNWTKVLGLVRPLCLQQSAVHTPPHSPREKIKVLEISPPQPRSAEVNPPMTPATMSQYGSAMSLRDLDDCSDDDDEEFSDEVFDAISYDEMIDEKAEEFIAQFYKQIHLEKGVPASRHHHERGV